jgi:diacylglycerol kinase (ATP)
MRYLFILNPKSGKKNKSEYIVDLVRKTFKDTDHTCEFVYTAGPGDATRLAENGVENFFDVISAVGGDGTVNEVAKGLVHTKCALGIIPLGSGNGLARSLKIPINIKRSIHCLMNPVITSIDTGRVNQYYFFGVCGIGLDAMIGKKFQEFGKRGPLPYFFIGLKEYINYKPDKYLIKNKNESFEIEPLLITIANTLQYGNGAIIAPQADPRDGKLDVCIIYKMPVLKALFYGPRLFRGTIHTIPYYKSFKTKSLQITLSEKKGVIHTDGEPFITDNVLNINILSRSLHVCTPSG